MSSVFSSLHILEINPLSDTGLVKTFSHSLHCPFVLFTMSLALQKRLSFRRSHLFIVLSVCATTVIFRKGISCFHVFKATCDCLFYTVQYNWIHAEVLDPFGCWFCSWGLIWIYMHPSTCWYLVMPAPFVEHTFFFHCTIFASMSKIRCSLS